MFIKSHNKRNSSPNIQHFHASHFYKVSFGSVFTLYFSHNICHCAAFVTKFYSVTLNLSLYNFHHETDLYLILCLHMGILLFQNIFHDAFVTMNHIFHIIYFSHDQHISFFSIVLQRASFQIIV